MKKLKFGYCNQCEDLVEFDIHEEYVEENYRGKPIKYKFKLGRCKNCNSEVATDIDYNSRKSNMKAKAYEAIYKKKSNICTD